MLCSGVAVFTDVHEYSRRPPVLWRDQLLSCSCLLESSRGEVKRCVQVCPGKPVDIVRWWAGEV